MAVVLLGWHGLQPGIVTLSDRKVRVHKPRLRRKGTGSGGEVEVPAYEAMQRDGRLRERMARLRQQAEWLETEHPTAAASLREGLEETFTVNAMGLPAGLRRCLATTNLIESPQSGVRMRTRRVTRWRDGGMALRWAAAAFLETERHFRRIMGYEQLWMLKSYLDGAEGVALKRKVG